MLSVVGFFPLAFFILLQRFFPEGEWATHLLNIFNIFAQAPALLLSYIYLYNFLYYSFIHTIIFIDNRSNIVSQGRPPSFIMTSTSLVTKWLSVYFAN